MSAISGTRRAMKEMADGTIRVQVDIDPGCRGAFLSLFPNIDMPVALAPLVADFERRAPEPEEKPKGGELARVAGMFTNDSDFHDWLSNTDNSLPDACFSWTVDAWKEYADKFIKAQCGISSKVELDHSATAAASFHERVRRPFVAWRNAA